MADFVVGGGGTTYTLMPLTDAARAWVAEHLPDIQPWQRLGDNIGIEHRFIGNIVDGIVGDGLTVE